MLAHQVDIRPTPKFTNATKLFAMCTRDHLKVVRVIGGTANITNGHVLLRRKVSAPDGVYDVNMDGSLSPTTYEYGMQYPDLEMIRPPFEKMAPYCQIPHDVIGQLIKLCQEAQRIRGDLVIEKGGVFMYQNPNINMPFSFNLPKSVMVNPKYFEVALIEMLQYPFVYLLQQEKKSTDSEGFKAPLVLGMDWGSCALIMPMNSDYDED